LRRFNQAALIANALGRLSRGREVDCFSLLRIERTASQQRWRNLSGAFKVAPCAPCPHQRPALLLVDDVITTGTTADACARALKRAEAVRVVWRSPAHRSPCNPPSTA
jgi:predicted amidophosphoribosyltransferase